MWLSTVAGISTVMIHERGNRHIWMPMTSPRSVQQPRSAVAGISTMTPSFRLSNCFDLLARIAIHARGNQCTTNDIALLARVATHARGNQHTTSHIAASAKWIKKPFICQIISLCSRESQATLAGTNTPPMTLICSRESRFMLVGINTSPMTLLRRLNGFRNLSRTGPCSWESTRGPVLMGMNTWRSRICSARTPETFRVATGREAGRQAVLRAAICNVALKSMK